MTASIQDAQRSAELYLREAEYCANCAYNPADPHQVLGIAAMQLALACVVSFGEILFEKKKHKKTGYPPKDKQLVFLFCRKMKSHQWLMPTEAAKHKTPADILYKIRNALVHGLALPDAYELLATAENYQRAPHTTGLIVVVPKLLIASVRETIAAIAAENPTLTPNLNNEMEHRGFVVLRGLSGPGASAAQIDDPQKGTL